MIGTWNPATPAPGDPPASSQLATPADPGARSIRGSSWWKRSIATRLNEATMRSRRFVLRSSRASSSALRTYSASASAVMRPLISMLTGVRGKARITSASVGTLKSVAS